MIENKDYTLTVSPTEMMTLHTILTWIVTMPIPIQNIMESMDYPDGIASDIKTAMLHSVPRLMGLIEEVTDSSQEDINIAVLVASTWAEAQQ